MSAPEPDWSGDLSAVAEALTKLLTTPQVAGEVDLDVAAAARATVLHTAAAALTDLAPRDAGHRSPRHLAEIEHDPLTGLVRLLAHRPRPALSRSPSELLDPASQQPARRADPATRAWMDAGRHALAAGATWTAEPRQLDTDWAWRTVADLAGICEAVAVLDADLHPVAAATGRTEITDLLTGTTGLHLAAAATRAIAAAQPEPAAPAPTITAPAPRTPPGPVVVTSPATMVEGLGRVTAMITAADVLTPAHVHNALRAARDLTAVIAAALPERRDQLDPLARRLHTAMSNAGSSQLAALLPSTSPGIDHQLGELHRFTRDHLAPRPGEPDPRTLDRAAAGQVAAMLPGLVDALTARSHAQIAARRWAIRDHSPRAELTDLPYRLAANEDPQRRPPLLPALHAAAAAATELRAVITTPRPGTAGIPPHRTLGEAIGRRAAATPLPDPARPPPRRTPRQGR